MTIDPQKLLAAPPAEVPFSYAARDTMLHGLGIGLGMDPLDTAQLPFVYEDGAPLQVFPTQSTVLGWVDLLRDARFADPAWGVDPNKMVVGDLVFRTRKPLPVAGEGLARSYFAEIVDKGKGKAALLRVRKEVLLGDEIVATLDTWLFVRAAGGFGGQVAGGPARVLLPVRAPDAVCDLPTPQNLALLFRLSLGDHNALHADPEHAQRVGFERPILHGIANFSIGVHAALQGLLDYDASAVAGGQARMSGPVFPGDTLRNELWREGDTVLFRTRAVERDAPVMDGGSIDLV
ncbi:MAG: 3-alpha,7-alpha,12-alpha-trihydroxy-5-beta-cholest-24-enoyl-CoA hydratase [Rhodospirillaceae bacterium]|jgi:acyl dehydratase|nr:3-alpha,7-alpha,12-alpha-trihydroxy-5-beta-cholest-24-enoyl-CoA hydratase [Rhodospirillaceae bacterium]